MGSDLRDELRWLSLVALALYFLVAYRVALASLGVAEKPAGAPRLASLTWLGRWRMFTELRDQHVILTAEALAGAGWTPIDLAAMFPSHRDEGPGYDRDDFYDDPRRREQLARALCARVAAPAVRLSVRRFPKTLGQREQPEQGATTAALGTWPCR
jgi:hypothetical protein